MEHETCDMLRDTPELAAAIITGIGLPNSRGLSPVTEGIQYGSDALNKTHAELISPVTGSYGTRLLGPTE
ncbi:hypothetical protein J7E93_06415 [Streptomyces sp. ISL-36]|uniref:hypothetical protein n=1 Tax=Streptomyces sp. ISL-36 TaxID=2819182 RepID=UPI001BE744D1|nr:hypothetical protein [Streptomyces sp. ISL-36]MBT2439760.1 hypothetical protein [Streptomyces sp. ISL-36]